MEQRTVAFIGAGNMARSIIAGLVQSGYPASAITAVNRTPEKSAAFRESFGINANENAIESAANADVVVLGVKPQAMAELLESMKSIDWQGKLVISIAAGISVTRLSDMAGTELNLVRVMPNTPSLVGEGMSGLYAPDSVSENDRAFAGQLLEAVGKVCWVSEESGINGIIAAAGSAPAYFFLFMEAMQAEAERQGFDKQTARALVQQSALGAAKMVVANPDIELATLREQVTSKGGTTAQALSVFNNNQLPETVAEAMQAAVRRAEEMESLF
ncbi:pyrroline-5-carboxylate reductase [Enterovibrio norvegicus]|uniref:Pyrroline-5-carboxylate reductase n=1 Tax=Enterovibrio norvegicus DSM 15893 TaxID=1121869 RepID=A0A1I5X8W1_9GAMM|nr:pyrroline-5-carboxylate reductase [Enterovibrio norvegicus]MCC4801081.1 pyrroline-5-carboxylate reductase [Enterovibrio norvegicus]OEE56491.1 pyrroline-5-carboxylate reductase [Enterovibrio norvegicus]OEF54119.1 pyrroline-5-carboxylate reductase [Enterovibrio norvegicus]PMI27333.1 pyrroline-5-carboxylate reductase [Enterovibrio norvegicus]TKF14457.1 pyrroline-5-carboxylate reductase [Enterovibrio norvegicus]